MLNKTMHKTRLTQNMKAKHTSNAKAKKTKTRKGKERKSDKIIWSLFPFTPWKNLSIRKPLIRQWWGRIETVQFRKEHEGFEKISKRSKGGWKLILISRWYHTLALLSGEPLVAIRSSMSSCSTVMTEMPLLLFRPLSVSFLSPRVFDFFLILLMGCS